MSIATVAAPSADPVDALIRSIRIPPRPSLLISMQEELDAPEPSQPALARIISSDVAMSASLLKLANSSMFGRRTIKSIDQALAFLGLNQVAALMTGLLARQAIAPSHASLASFWEVSSRRAQAMVFLSRRLHTGPADVAHTFGLFCDTGIPLMMERFPDYARTLDEAGASAGPFTRVEDARHTTNHAAIGCLLARNWGLPTEVSWSILHHHDYEVIEDRATPESVRSMVAASLLCERAIQDFQGLESAEWAKGGAIACAHFGLGETEADELQDELVEAFHED
ncbi:HDOD domain-containing protein [Pseudoduganella sp. GCM10020061]|uniref:HDOD domain-containing protein n=1 Tax=Pseudoduganella sp. GCM10020061 TaxID=3317345 RepID=UPI00362F90D5